MGAYVSGDGLGLASKIARSYPEKSVIILERELREENMRRAIFAGARDVLIYPFDPAKLVDSVYRCYQVAQERRAEQQRERKARKKLGPAVVPFWQQQVATWPPTAAPGPAPGAVPGDLDLDFGNAAPAMTLFPLYHFQPGGYIRYLDQDLLRLPDLHDSGKSCRGPSRSRRNLSRRTTSKRS